MITQLPIYNITNNIWFWLIQHWEFWLIIGIISITISAVVFFSMFMSFKRESGLLFMIIDGIKEWIKRRRK